MKHISRIFLGAVLALAGLCPSVASAQDAVSLPFKSDFTTQTGWTLLNEDGKNVWVIGEDANTKNEGGACLFISPDGTKFANGLAPGTGGVQIQKISSIAHAYFKVNLPADKTMILTFRYFVNGNSGSLSNDYVKAGLYVGVFSEMWQEGKAPGTASEYIESYYKYTAYSTGEWQDAVIAIDGSEHSGDQYVVFTWRNDESSPFGIFAAVDNVELRVDDCPAPSALTVGEVAAHSITYSWTAGGGISGLNDYTYQIQKREGAGHWEDVTPAPAADATSFTLPDLKDHADYRFRIRGYRSESSYSPWVTSAIASTPYACAAPTDLAMVMNGDGDYVFTWNGSHAQYNLEYKEVGTATWTVVSNLTSPTYTLGKTGLASGTMYNVRVRGVCEAGDTPHYADQVVAFATLPYVENFDTWNADKTLTGWSIVDGNNDKYVWQEETSTKFGSSGSCAKYQGAMSNNGNDYLISPAIRIDQAAQLSFQMKTTGTINKYSVLISEKTNAVADFEKELQAETTVSVAQDWTLMSWDLTDYIGKNIYIAIKATTAQSYSFPNLYIDDFAILTCPTPIVSLTATTDNSADFSLSPADASCRVEYREAGAEAWTALAENKTGSFSLTDLPAGRLCEVRAQTYCSEDMHSDYSSVVTFMLPVIRSFPLNETFSAVAAGTVPEGWSQMDAVGNHRWVVGRNETESYLAYNGRDNSEGHAYITTPVIDLTAVADDVRANLELKLVFQDPKQNQYQNWFSVSLSADRGLSWQPVAEIVPEGRQRETFFVPLAAYVGEATSVMVRLEATNQSSFPANDSLRVYEIHVQPESACFPPTGITVPGRTLKASEAVVLWTAPQKCHPTGYELAYRIKDDENETVLTVGVSVSDIKLGALTENTLYEVAMASVCGENKSELSAPVAFTTPYACPKVRSLRAVAEKEAVTLTYPSDGATFEVEYRTSAETEWHSFSKTLTEKTCRITGLTAGTVYWARVRVLCDAETSSLWDSVRFATLCEAEPLPFAETFNGEFIDNAPLCWRYTHLAGSAEDIQWQLAKTVAHGDSAALRYVADRVGSGHSALMVSPQLEMTGDRQVLSFWMNRSEYGTRTTEEGLYVYLNSRPDTVGATRVAFLRNYLYDLTHEAVRTDSTWSLYQFELPVSKGAMYIVLQGVSAGLGSFYVDEIKVEAEYDSELITIVLSDTICDGETYRFGERELTEAGRYFDTIRATAADTARELTLTVLSKPEPPVVSREDEGKTVTLVAATPEAQVQWYEADGMIFGAEEKRFTVPYDGVYHATAIGVCGESAPSNKVKIENLSVEDGLSADAPVVYPNPARTEVHLRAVTPIRKWRILSVGGMEIAGENGLNTTQVKLSVHTVNQGFYVLYVETDGGNYTYKLQVIR